MAKFYRVTLTDDERCDLKALITGVKVRHGNLPMRGSCCRPMIPTTENGQIKKRVFV
jgi:hypothetical protein